LGASRYRRYCVKRRKAGLELVTLAEHYGIPADEKVEDVTWLAETAARGW
jgi:hypothetical protein